MLRTSLRSVRGAGGRSFAAAASRQWQLGAAAPARVTVKRFFADQKIPEPAVIPPSETRTAAASQSPPPTSQARVEASQIQPENVPLTPPTASVAPPKKKKGFFRRLRNYILTMTVLGALAFGGGVWYSRINDSFHDFFTGFVPYGEQAVLYLEEMDFRKRFPRIAQRGGSSNPRDPDASVRIPAQSGASWRVADTEPPVKRESSAVKAEKAKQAAKAKAPPKEEPAPEVKQSAPVKKPTASPKAKASQVAAPAPAAAPAAAAFTPPEVDEPSRWPPASPIDPLAVNDASEPVVQDLVKLLNDIITVVNADGANERYGPTIGKAKQAAEQLGGKIREMKKAAQDEAAVTVKEQIDRLETHAADLISRIEGHMTAQESRWREEFEAEMARAQEMFDARLKTMTEREREVVEAKMQNRLLEQALELQRQFKEEIKQRVETEREGRLGQLESLSTAVSELDQLTSSLDEVVDVTKKTQQLNVAVDAVRASLEASSTGPAAPPRPFIRELAALKEIAQGDDVVDAAIASIHPSAYQRGIPSTAELIDRFRRVATEVRKAALLPNDAGVASHASSYVLSKVLFTKQPGPAAEAGGDDVESVLTRAQTYLEQGELDAAAREVNGLKGWAKTLSRDWLAEVRKVLEVRQALDVIQTEARLRILKVE
ncbi:hypothetical protein RB595_005538 [Gaeumannomyces hyphopodioides]